MKGDMPSGPDLEGVAPLLMLIELGLCDVSRDLGTVLLGVLKYADILLITTHNLNY